MVKTLCGGGGVAGGGGGGGGGGGILFCLCALFWLSCIGNIFFLLRVVLLAEV